jgi:hypothetical protein
MPPALEDDTPSVTDDVPAEEAPAGFDPDDGSLEEAPAAALLNLQTDPCFVDPVGQAPESHPDAKIKKPQAAVAVINSR